VCTDCAPGLYGTTQGLATAACTAPCLPGRYGAVAGVASENCTGPCSAGYACPAGSQTPTVTVCPAGRFSLSGASVCELCAAGKFGSSAGNTAPCTASCPAGSFCVAGSAAAVPCAPGRFGASTDLENDTCTGPCPAGSYCPLGAVSPLLCPAGDVGKCGRVAPKNTASITIHAWSAVDYLFIARVVWSRVDFGGVLLLCWCCVPQSSCLRAVVSGMQVVTGPRCC
jgi:hypothetical protein